VILFLSDNVSVKLVKVTISTLNNMTKPKPFNLK
jgi:hypothetical protein